MSSSFFSKNHFSYFIFLVAIVLLSYCLIAPQISLAQFGGVGLSDTDISLDVSPENPGPNQNVTIIINSYAADLNAATMTWIVNGKTVLTGNGKKQLVVTTGKIGQATAVKITINTSVGSVVKTFTIIPTSVNMIWEANTYTPPFFKGRPLFTPESSVTIIAVPHIMKGGNEISPKNLIYTWSNNGTVLGDKSGYGADSLTLAGSILPRPMDISVEATDPESNTIADGDVTLTPQNPLLLFYKNDPLYGVQYEKAIQGSYALTGDEVDVVAVPYYFSTKIKNSSNMTYSWEINGIPINDGINSADKVFRRAGDVSGTSNISVSVAQGQTIFQTATKNFLIDFQKNTNQVVF